MSNDKSHGRGYGVEISAAATAWHGAPGGAADTAANADALAIGVLQLGATPAASARRRYMGAAGYGHQARLSPVPQRWCMKRSQGENSALSARRPMRTITSMIPITWSIALSSRP